MAFKIKDEVFFMKDNKPTKGTITSIVKTGEKGKITYVFGTSDYVEAEKVFATKEQLKNYLFNE